jgi:YVTN family beta-propeller protein
VARRHAGVIAALLLAVLVWSAAPPARAASITSIPVGVLPAGVAIDPSRNAVYVANEGDGTVSVVDPIAGVVTATISLVGDARLGGAPAPVGVAVDPGLGLAYVTEAGAGRLAVIDEATWRLRTTVSVDGVPWGVAVDPTTHAVYVTCLAGSVDMIDGTTQTLRTRVGDAALRKPAGVAVDASTHAVYVANLADNTVSRIDGGSLAVTATIAVGSAPVAVAIAPGGGAVYVADSGSAAVSVIDPTINAVRATWSTGQGPLALASDGTGVLYALAADGTVTAFDPSGTTLATLADPALNGLQGVAAGPSAVYMTAGAGNALLALPLVAPESSPAQQ